MPEADIYKTRERMPYSNQSPKRSNRRRRSSAQQKAFDDPSRKRRSKNSGLRRLLHLYRKKDNEKVFWWSVLVALVVFLGSLAIWQFVIREYLIHRDDRKNEQVQYQQLVPDVETLPAEQPSQPVD